MAFICFILFWHRKNEAILWFLLLTWCHFQPLMTFSHSWLEMAPGEKQKPFHFLYTSDGKQILICLRHCCKENEMVFVSHEVTFPATSDRVAGNGTKWKVKTIEFSSSTSGGEQLSFLNFLNFTAVKKTISKLRKVLLKKILQELMFCLLWNQTPKCGYSPETFFAACAQETRTALIYP